MTMQKPITEGMTPEQLKQYNEEVHEAQRSNAYKPIDMRDAWRGHSSYTSAKPLSDYSTYQPAIRRMPDAFSSIYAPLHTKQELIQKWTNIIAEMEQKIKEIRADETLPASERKTKIARRMEIIRDCRFSLKQAQEYIKSQKQREKKLYEEYMKKK